MSGVRGFEQKLESLISGVFTRTFKSEVQPVDIASALQREIDQNAQILSRDTALVPNVFIVNLSEADHDRLNPFAAKLTEELTALLIDYAADQRYTFTGAVSLTLERDASLTLGQVMVRSRAEADAPGAAPAAESAAPAAPASAEQLTTTVTSGPVLPPQGPRPVMVLEIASIYYEVTPPGLVVGRGADCPLRIEDPGVSRKHLELRVLGTGPTAEVMAVDLGSTNGTIVDGNRITQTTLRDGSRITIGNTLMIAHRRDPRVAGLRRPGATGGNR